MSTTRLRMCDPRRDEGKWNQREGNRYSTFPYRGGGSEKNWKKKKKPLGCDNGWPRKYSWVDGGDWGLKAAKSSERTQRWQARVSSKCKL